MLMAARFSAPIQTGPDSCTMGIDSFPGVNWPGYGTSHPSPSTAKVRERVELYLYSTSGPSLPVLGCTLPFHLLCTNLVSFNLMTEMGWSVEN
jgi:hypothetical protein